jgi:DNA-binding transcriptional LysR family regulator
VISPRDLPLLPVFVAVATTGSFTAAAHELGLAKSVVSQHIRTLETRCGVRLIERTTRRLRITQVGAQVLAAAEEALRSVRTIERIVEGQSEEPSGVLRVTAPTELGASLLAPVCADLLRRYPLLRVEMFLDDVVRDLVRDGLDLALRLGPVTESSYVVKKLSVEPEIIVASPRLAATRGDVEPRDLAGAPWVTHMALRGSPSWTFRSEGGARQDISVELRAAANNSNAIRRLFLGGVGYGVTPARMATRDLESGRLVNVCPGWYHRRVTLHALLPTRHSPPRVHALLVGLTEATARAASAPASSRRARGDREGSASGRGAIA